MTTLACAIYTRKSSEEGLEQGFNSLDAQREACEAFILSQKAQGWKAAETYDDGGFSGGNTDRPGLRRLLADIALGRVNVIVVYKVDRLTRSLADFAKLVERFDAQGVSFVSVTQQFNTTSSMGRLTLNVLLSFAQFEREVTGERIRDKIAASKRKGMWMGGYAAMGYRPHERTLRIDEPEAERVREIYRLYLDLRSVYALKAELDRRGWTTPVRQGKRIGGGRPFTRGHLYRMLTNPVYVGRISHKGVDHPGQHPGIVELETFDAAGRLLALNAREHQERTHAAEASLLAGIAFDEHGQKLKPTHAVKSGKRYRYYFQDAPAGTNDRAFRIPAVELEGAVVRALRATLDDRSRMFEAAGDVDAQEIQRRLAVAADAAARLTSTVDRLKIVGELVERVEVRRESLEMRIQPGALWGDASTASIKIKVPVDLKRCGKSVRLIVRSEEMAPYREPNRQLIELLTKARRWMEALTSGTSKSVLEIAQETGTDSAEVVRIIYLACLAPELVQRIVEGRQPPQLGVKRLLAMAPLALRWTDQHGALGFET